MADEKVGEFWDFTDLQTRQVEKTGDRKMENENIGQETVEETKEQRAAKLAAFKASGGVQQIAPNAQQAANAGTVAASVKPVKAKPVKTEVPEMNFPYAEFSQSGKQSFIVVMSYRQVRDYTAYARDLYEVVETDDGKNVEPDVETTWQRKITPARQKAVGTYLTQNDWHFLPPILCIPAQFDSVTVGDGMLTIKPAGLGVLDGQTRRGGILAALDFLEDRGDYDEHEKSLDTETIPVVIIMLDDLEEKQQVFADVNRTPKTVSKALNLVFDNRESVALLAKEIAKNKDFTTAYFSIITKVGATPKKASSDALSLKNLYDFLCRFNYKNFRKPQNGSYRDEKGDAVFSPELSNQLASAVVNNLPGIEKLRHHNATFGNMKEYLCYSSTAWQALGQVIKDLSMTKLGDGSPKYKADDLPNVIGLMVGQVECKLVNPRWADPNRRVVIDGKNIGTQKDYVNNLVAILKEMVTD
jgi:DGQHR domain-containing protein